MSTLATTPSRSDARERLLDTGSALFYREGIRAVGVDRIFDEAKVTRATFYRHFSGKQALVAAYLDREDAIVRGFFDAAAARATSPRHFLELAIEGIETDAVRNHTRGCPFINAAVEYPNADSVVRVKVTEHRDWFGTTLRDALEAAGVEDADARASTLVLLRDAMLVGGYLDDAKAVGSSFMVAARREAGLE